MKSVLNFLRLLIEGGKESERERQEAYLAESTDIYDLEYRIRELDRESRHKPPWMGTTGWS